ncbi:uncharacterized protein LOC106660818 [Cimex lectularius]|uniref:Telomere-associated protein RIF1 n=1 Tax=Cimex lectularius TaxID=79782 RepID=A0A8I6R8J8_CIMLE|nr:uncharacterized protein LOC106660818 [Cimex lectularius]
MEIYNRLVKNLKSSENVYAGLEEDLKVLVSPGDAVKKKLVKDFKLVLPRLIILSVEADPNTKKAIQQTFDTLKNVLIANPSIRAEPWWKDLETNIVSNIFQPKMIKGLENNDTSWVNNWSFVANLMINGAHVNGSAINALLKIVETAFKMSKKNMEIVDQAYTCWMELIEIFSLHPRVMPSKKLVGLLVKPLATTLQPKTFELKIKTWNMLVEKIGVLHEECVLTIVKPFITYMYQKGPDSLAKMHPNECIFSLEKLLSYKNIRQLYSYDIIAVLSNCVEFKLDHNEFMNLIDKIIEMIKSFEGAKYNNHLQELVKQAQKCMGKLENCNFPVEQIKRKIVSIMSVDFLWYCVEGNEIPTAFLSSLMDIDDFKNNIFMPFAKSFITKHKTQNVVETKNEDLLGVWDAICSIMMSWITKHKSVQIKDDEELIFSLIIFPLSPNMWSSAVNRLWITFCENLYKYELLTADKLISFLENQLNSSDITIPIVLESVTNLSNIDKNLIKNVIPLLESISENISNDSKQIMDVLYLVEIAIGIASKSSIFRLLNQKLHTCDQLQQHKIKTKILKLHRKLMLSGDVQDDSSSPDIEQQTKIRSSFISQSNFLHRLAKAEEKNAIKKCSLSTLFSPIDTCNEKKKENEPATNETPTKGSEVAEENVKKVLQEFQEKNEPVVQYSNSIKETIDKPSNEVEKENDGAINYHVTVPSPVLVTPSKIHVTSQPHQIKNLSPQTIPITKKSPKVVAGIKNVTPKRTTPSKCTYFDEDASDYVMVTPKQKKRVLTEHQKEVFSKRRSDIPALYQDLSQDTQNTSSYLKESENSESQKEMPYEMTPVRKETNTEKTLDEQASVTVNLTPLMNSSAKKLVFNEEEKLVITEIQSPVQKKRTQRVTRANSETSLEPKRKKRKIDNILENSDGNSSSLQPNSNALCMEENNKNNKSDSDKNITQTEMTDLTGDSKEISTNITQEMSQEVEENSIHENNCINKDNSVKSAKKRKSEPVKWTPKRCPDKPNGDSDKAKNNTIRTGSMLKKCKSNSDEKSDTELKDTTLEMSDTTKLNGENENDKIKHKRLKKNNSINVSPKVLRSKRISLKTPDSHLKKKVSITNTEVVSSEENLGSTTTDDDFNDKSPENKEHIKKESVILSEDKSNKKIEVSVIFQEEMTEIEIKTSPPGNLIDTTNENKQVCNGDKKTDIETTEREISSQDSDDIIYDSQKLDDDLESNLVKTGVELKKDKRKSLDLTLNQDAKMSKIENEDTTQMQTPVKKRNLLRPLRRKRLVKTNGNVSPTSNNLEQWLLKSGKTVVKTHLVQEMKQEDIDNTVMSDMEAEDISPVKDIAVNQTEFTSEHESNKVIESPAKPVENPSITSNESNSDKPSYILSRGVRLLSSVLENDETAKLLIASTADAGSKISSPVSMTSPMSNSRGAQMMRLAKEITPISNVRKRKSIVPLTYGENWPKGPSEEWIAHIPTPSKSPSKGLLKNTPTNETTNKKFRQFAEDNQETASTTPKKKRVSFLDPPVSRGLVYYRENNSGNLHLADIPPGEKPVWIRQGDDMIDINSSEETPTKEASKETDDLTPSCDDNKSPVSSDTAGNMELSDSSTASDEECAQLRQSVEQLECGQSEEDVLSQEKEDLGEKYDLKTLPNLKNCVQPVSELFSSMRNCDLLENELMKLGIIKVGELAFLTNPSIETLSIDKPKLPTLYKALKEYLEKQATVEEIDLTKEEEVVTNEALKKCQTDSPLKTDIYVQTCPDNIDAFSQTEMKSFKDENVQFSQEMCDCSTQHTIELQNFTAQTDESHWKWTADRIRGLLNDKSFFESLSIVFDYELIGRLAQQKALSSQN